MSYIRPAKTRLTVAKADYLTNVLYQKCHVMEESKHTVVLELSSSGLTKLCNELVKLHFKEIC
jgi:hypothetical protein